ncbi:Ku protein [Leifsonia shinshuensis]|uniref:non-homologous end joining protein Ku n=1 Tax=Leifsonia shinshuensis TaxID=150026 RepID=UPI00286349B5|nr:Ku protein [Leifsonia shinshuensis]MDR6970952.1 DNA end-binding protein Ku [Leifsonia shinshuensis]
MRAIWTGAITFGLVNVPVKVYSATEDHDVPLHQVHDEDGGRIRYQRRCEIDGKVIPYEHIAKAYEYGERTVILTPEDLASLPSERSREIDVVEFVPNDQLDPLMFDRSYYLEPDSKSLKAYALLRKTLEDEERTAIVEFALRQKTRLAALRVRGNVLVLQTLLWHDEIREADFPSLDQTPRISDRELQLSSALMESFAGDFEPEKFSDEYQEELRKLIDAKLEEGDSVDTAATFGEEEEAKKGGGEVIDLMEALQRSVERSRSSKSSSSSKTSSSKSSSSKSASNASEKKPAARKTSSTSSSSTTTRKAPAKKSAKKPA